MRTLFSCLLLSLVVSMGTESAAQTPFARLQPGTLYTGEARQRGLIQQAELCLLEDGYFVLRQSFRKGSQDFTRYMTGLWLQTDDGALLQLDNDYGLSLRCNVGGERNLYCPLPGIAGQQTQSMLLREGPFAMPEFSVMGKLERQEEYFVLTDSATGRVFQLKEDPKLAEIRCPLFVDALIRPVGRPHEREYVLLRLRSSSRAVPTTSETDFTADVASSIWLMQVEGETATCVFMPGDDKQGVLTISGPGLYLRLPYAIDGPKMVLTVQPSDIDMLRGLGIKELLHLPTVERWRLSGPALVLHTANGRQFILKRTDSDPFVRRIDP